MKIVQVKHFVGSLLMGLLPALAFGQLNTNGVKSLLGPVIPGTLKTAVGSTPSEFNVTALGASNYAMPILTPSGINGLQPQLSITYSSQKGDGLLGIGWNLAGATRAISRIGQTMYFDNKITSVDLSVNDRLIFDGQRLLPVDGTNYWNATTFRSEKESFSNIYLKTNTDGTIYYEVVTPDSLRMEFGSTAASRIDGNGAPATKTLTWYLNKITDTYGNTIVYTYTPIDVNGREKVLQKIEYANTAVVFIEYELRADPNKSFLGGIEYPFTQRISNIYTQAAGNWRRQYTFTYQTSTIDTKLTQIREYASSDIPASSEVQVKATNIEWGSEAPKLLGDNSIRSGYPYDVIPDNTSVFYTTLDYDGDGLTDMIKAEKINHDTNYPSDNMCGDLVAAANPDPVYPSVLNWHPCRDGADYTESALAGHAPFNYNYEFKWQLYRNTGNGLFSPIGASNTVLGTLCNYFTPYQIQSAKIMRMDYNGDGYDDWVVTSEEVRYPLVYDANNVQLPDKHRYTKVKIEIYLSTPAATQPYTATPITINHQYDLNPDNIDQQLQYLVTDLDGDKKQEILITYSTGLTFLYSQTINTVIQLPGSGAVTANGDFMWTLMPLDYNGNGKTDLMFINKQANTSRYNLYELTQPLNNLLTPGASNFKLLTTGNDRFNVGDFLYTGDFNGDGKTDILARPRNDDPADFAQLKTWGVHYNTDKSDGSDGFTWQANVLNDILGTKVPATYTKYQCYESYNPLGVYVADFNADGLSDILMVENHKYTIPTVGGIDVSCKFYMSKGMGLNAPISKRLHLEGNADDARTLFGNFDGNSTLDLLVENGWASAPDSLIRILQKPGTDRLVTHISNNRETDTYITYAQTTDVSGIHTRTGTGTIPAADYPLKARELNAPLNIVSQVKQLNGNTDPAKQFTTTNYTYKGLKAHNDLGILGFEEMTATTDLYNEDGTTTPVKTVNTYEFWLNDQYNTRIYAPEQKSVTTYLGTKKVGEMIRTNGVQTYTNVGDAALGLDKRRYTTFAQTVSSTEYDVMTAANLPLRNTLTTYSRFGTAIDKYYDNITSMTKDVKRYVSGAWVTDLTNTLSFTYDYTQPPPNKHKPKSIKTEVKRGTAIGEARKVTMTYDAKGETASSTILFYDNTIYPVTDIRSTNRSLKIDNTYMLQFGNLAAQKITDLTDGKTRQVNYGYTTQAGMNGQFLVQQNLTDASGTLLSLQTFKANVLGWDGQPKEIEDNAGNLTELLYDQWDDLQSAALPNGRNLQVAKSIVTATDPDKPANAIAKSEIFTNTINPTLSDKTTYFDRMGRVLRTVTLYDDNPTVNVAEPTVKQLRYSDVSYNLRGQVASVSEPYQKGAAAATIKYTTYIYYDDGRLKQVTPPTGTYTLYEYNGFTAQQTVNNASGGMTARVTTQTVDATGAIQTATDPGGSIAYAYYSSGKLQRITNSQSGIMEFKYDPYGNVKEEKDPNAGTTTATYNGFGEALQTISPAPNGFATATVTKTSTYDNFGRVSNLNAPEGNYTFNYDAATGKLLDRQAPNGWKESFAFDGLLRMVEHKFQNVTVATEPILSTKYTYDAYGRLGTVEYPDATKTSYDYNFYENLCRVNLKETGMALPKPIWDATANNIYGQTTSTKRYTYTDFAATAFSANNYLQTVNDFSALGYAKETKITKVTNGTPAATPLHNWQYQFDEKTGNLTNRTDKLANNGAGKTENFTYDALLDRLTTSTIAGGATNTITYNTGGNITNKSDAGTMVYGTVASRPNAVLSVKPFVVANVLPSAQNISYNSFSKAVKMTEDMTEANTSHTFKQTTIDYAPDGERIKMTYQTQAAPLTPNPAAWATQYTRYYADNFEREVSSNGTVTTRCYIYASEGLIAVNQKTVVNTTTTQKLLYIGTDYLGSLLTFVDATGAVVEKHSYDAWGRMRDPNTWTAYTNAAPAPAMQFARGYTGHEGLPEFGLINMNGRLYDPLFGRMLSPDNNIGSGINTQDLNRYTYAANNPLRYTDPSGWNYKGNGTGSNGSGGGDAISEQGIIALASIGGAALIIGVTIKAGGLSAGAGTLGTVAGVSVSVAAAAFAGAALYATIAITNTILDGFQYSVQSAKTLPISAPNYAPLNQSAAANARNGMGSRAFVKSYDATDFGEDPSKPNSPLFTPKVHLTGNRNLMVIIYDGENALDENYLKAIMANWDYIQVEKINDVADILEKNKTLTTETIGIKSLLIKAHGGTGYIMFNYGKKALESPTDAEIAKGLNALKSILANDAVIVSTSCSFYQGEFRDEADDKGFADFWTSNSKRTLYLNTIFSETMSGGIIRFGHGLAHHFDGGHNTDSWDGVKGFIQFTNGARSIYQPCHTYKQISILKEGGFNISMQPLMK